MMKQISISLLFLVGILLQSNAQITVAEDNNVGIGITDPESKLSVGHTGYSHMTLAVGCTSTTSAARAGFFFKSANGGSYSFGLTGNNVLTSGGSRIVGGQLYAYNSTALSSKRSYGLRAIAGNATNGYNWAVFAHLGGSRNGAAIYGCIDGSETAIPGKYAGFFRGDVWVDDDLIVFGSFSNPSDINLKKEIRSVSTDSTSQVSKLKNLSAIKYKYKTPAELNDFDQAVLDTMKVDPRQKLYTSNKYTKDQIGFSAQEVQEVFPELVSETQDGYLALNYTGLIPILVEAIKEQDEAIAALDETMKKYAIELEKLKKEIEALKVSETSK